ncbi:MAG TPA: alanine--tRNA ligase [Bacteroidales bacterium]|nr:alanine--tRNA ligase [Bacteroidales bacterium]
MKSAQIRQTFLDFFASRQHKIVPSAPMVVRNDPTLMFTNAGMNQFKDIFLGNSPIKFTRIANSQKCLRVSGKHNDLEEVGHDTYHHTMFEMLGNWSFGDYFKKEAIEWGWELLTDVFGLEKDRLYVTVFGGDDSEGLAFDSEAFDVWKTILPEDRILYGSKKDNFWEMGDAGPCGPCSEIHIDLRSQEERVKKPGHEMVNTGHPEVIEIWNLVFIQFNRKNDGSLEPLPARHVDTGMGFERLTMAMQKKKSNYDTDIFQPIISEIGYLAGKSYGDDARQDVAMRVIADHLRAIAFAIADGQLPSNNKAGYVIRRILRRAVRYGFTFLDLKEPFINKLVKVLVDEMGSFFPELKAQQGLIVKVILEEEIAFLRTLSHGIRRFEQYLEGHPGQKVIAGDFAFELFDTYGFPVDLTQLMAREKELEVDMTGFSKGLEQQKQRSRQAAEVDTDEWVEIRKGADQTTFLGYDSLVTEANILKFRKVKTKKETFYQIVLDQTPFYAESGGQVGDRGVLDNGNEKIEIKDTQKENNLIVHITDKLPADLSATFTAIVDTDLRRMTTNNHSATHLMHAALKRVLGTHVEQRGSLVDENRLRFDFSHFSKMTPEEIRQVEQIVNAKIRENIPVHDQRHVPIDEARAMGASALFGEKYGEYVRVITFDPSFSIEFCGGTHVPATGQIGMFKIVSETAVAAGIRRIEAITADRVEELLYSYDEVISGFKEVFKNQKDILSALYALLDEKKALEKQIEAKKREEILAMKSDLKKNAQQINGVNFIATKIDGDAQAAKDLAFMMKDIVEDLFLVVGTVAEGKAGLTVMISENLTKSKGLNAGQIVREIAKEINGGGGGQPYFATAGGKNPDGLDNALAKAKTFLLSAKKV